MKSHLKFRPQIDSLEERLAPASIPITLPSLGTSSIVVTLPTTPPVPPSPPSPPSPPVPTDDTYEDNDSFGTAADLGTLKGTANATATKTVTGLKLLDNADWFKITTTLPGSAGASISISFDNSRGDLNLRLFDSIGTPLSSSMGTGNTEAVSLASLPAGTYVVQVRGLAGVSNPEYTLSLKQAIVTNTPSVPPAPPAPPPPPGVPTIPPPPPNGFNIVVRGTGLTPAQLATFQQAANRWGQIIVGDLPDAIYVNGLTSTPVDDLLIDASSISLDGVGGILGQAAPDRFRVGSGLPFHGFMQFDTADLASLEARGSLYYVVLHEMGHVLGFGSIWQQKGLITGAGTNVPLFIGRQAAIEYNKIFKQDGSTIPLETGGGQGTRDAHWSERIFKNELMTGFLDPGVNPLSRVTAASMGDLGYTVNIDAADAFNPLFLAPPSTTGQKPVV